MFLHFEDVGDQPSESCPTEQRRHKESTGYGHTVGPTSQEEIEHEEQQQSQRTEGSCE